jgi:hypothetical protein
LQALSARLRQQEQQCHHLEVGLRQQQQQSEIILKRKLTLFCVVIDFQKYAPFLKALFSFRKPYNTAAIQSLHVAFGLVTMVNEP